MKQGILISFEGMEGAGKSTQCALLSEKMKAQGYETVLIREPGGVPIAEDIRNVVLNAKNKEMAVTTEVLLFQAARAQLYDQVVIPSLQAGKVVIMDRTRDSSVVYQGVVRGVGVALIDSFNDYSTQKTLPVLTFLLDVPAEVGMDRITKSRELDRIESEGVELQEKVCQAYLDYAHQDTTGRWVIIDGQQTVEEIAQEVWKKVTTRLG